MATSSTMIRTQIFLHNKQKLKLSRLQKKMHLESASEIVRIAIDAYDPEAEEMASLSSMLDEVSAVLKEAIQLTRQTADRLEAKGFN